MSMTPEQAVEVLSLVAEYEQHDILWWRCDGDYAPITIWVRCSDAFCWGSADGEEVTPDNLPELRRAFEDAERVCPRFGKIYADTLFVARVRGMRPQGAAYPKDYPQLWPLFDACGPERETDLHNPCKPGEYPAEAKAQ